jgi:hypothetical protein
MKTALVKRSGKQEHVRWRLDEGAPRTSVVLLRRLCVLIVMVHGWGASAEDALPVQVGNTVATSLLVRLPETGQQWLVTAYHVVSRSGALRVDLGGGALRSVTALLGSGSLQACVVPDAEMFALRVPDGTSLPFTAAEFASSPSDGMLTAIGNARQNILGVKLLLRNSRGWAMRAARVRAEILDLADEGTAAGQTELLILLQEGITYGFSGGPVYRAESETRVLEGMIVGGDPTQGGGRAWALPADTIHRLLASECGLDLRKYSYDGQRLTLRAAPVSWPAAQFKHALYSRTRSTPPGAEIGLSLGIDYGLLNPPRPFSRAVLIFSPLQRFTRATLAYELGVGPAIASLPRRTFDPLGEKVLLEEPPTLFWGIRVQCGVQVRWKTRRPRLEARLGVRGAVERFVFSVPDEPNEPGQPREIPYVRLSGALLGGVAYAVNRVQFFLAPEVGMGRGPAMDSNYRGDLPNRTWRSPGRSFTLGLNAGFAIQL